MRLKAIVGALIAAGAISAAVGGYSQAGTAAFTKTRTTEPVAVATAQAPAAIVLPDFSALAERNSPAVVNITVSQDVLDVKGDEGMPQMPPMPQMDPDDPFYQFFKRFQGPQGQMPRQTPRGAMPHHAMGSGFIISSDGLILTNAHVVGGAKEVTVKLTDKREFKAKTIGFDRATDVAVIKVDAKDLPTVVIGNPDLAKPAVGRGHRLAFGMENTVNFKHHQRETRSLPDRTMCPSSDRRGVNPACQAGLCSTLRGE
jgi:serine protease Do